MRDLAVDADKLRALHVPGDPVVLANAWDPPSARLVDQLGFAAVATSSAAVAECHGFPDTDSMPPDVAFAAIGSVAEATLLPLTADCEAGYRLPADEFVERLYAAGAVGCNIEDTDHHTGGGPRRLVDADRHAQRLRSIKGAARAAGVELVLNARIDAILIGGDEAEVLRRAAVYRAAGADCVYPIGLADTAAIARVVEIAQVVNVLYRPGGPTLDELKAAGVARISLGSGLYRFAMTKVKAAMTALRAGLDAEVWQ